MRVFEGEIIHWVSLEHPGWKKWTSPCGQADAGAIRPAVHNSGIPNQYLHQAGQLSIHSLRKGVVYANEGHHLAVNRAA
jgi:hypothetical protein